MYWRFPQSIRPLGRPSPPRFSLRMLLATTVLYAILFAALRAIGIRDPFGFAAVVLALTWIALAQYWLYGGTRPLWSSTLGGTLLMTSGWLAGMAAIEGLKLGEIPVYLAALAVAGALAGLAVGTIVDLALVILEIIAGDHCQQRNARLMLLRPPGPPQPMGRSRWAVLLLLWAGFLACVVFGWT